MVEKKEVPRAIRIRIYGPGMDADLEHGIVAAFETLGFEPAKFPHNREYRVLKGGGKLTEMRFFERRKKDGRAT